ncbi:MAG: acyltransferase [Hyphomicrobium sp.]
MDPNATAAVAPRLAVMLQPDANSFAVVRIAMALAVLVSHGFYLYGGTTAAEPLVAWTGHSLGEHAVQVFFFLSGILVAQSFDRSRSLIDFTVGRVLRIFPGLAACILLTALVLGPLVSTLDAGAYFTSSEPYRYVLRTLSLSTGSAPLPGVFETLPAASIVNMSLWTLKYEVLCYAMLAVAGLVGLFAPRFRTIASVALALFIALVFIETPKAIETYTSLDNVRYFALFFATGVLAYLLRERVVVSGALTAALFVLFAVCNGTRFGELSSALFLGQATLYAARFSFGPLRGLANRFDLSYGVYIYACPVQQLLTERLAHIGPCGLIVLAVLLVAPMALVSWVFVERPALLSRKMLAAFLERLLPPVLRPRGAASNVRVLGGLGDTGLTSRSNPGARLKPGR